MISKSQKRIAAMLKARGRKVTVIDETKAPKAVADEVLRARQQPPPKDCDCINYESAEEDDEIGMGACHCGHSPEEHTFAGCGGPGRGH